MLGGFLEGFDVLTLSVALPCLFLICAFSVVLFSFSRRKFENISPL
jgi:hypothetical protein